MINWYGPYRTLFVAALIFQWLVGKETVNVPLMKARETIHESDILNY